MAAASSVCGVSVASAPATEIVAGTSTVAPAALSLNVSEENDAPSIARLNAATT